MQLGMQSIADDVHRRWMRQYRELHGERAPVGLQVSLRTKLNDLMCKTERDYEQTAYAFLGPDNPLDKEEASAI